MIVLRIDDRRGVVVVNDVIRCVTISSTSGLQYSGHRRDAGRTDALPVGARRLILRAYRRRPTDFLLHNRPPVSIDVVTTTTTVVFFFRCSRSRPSPASLGLNKERTVNVQATVKYQASTAYYGM
jgi:hypothetical protein